MMMRAARALLLVALALAPCLALASGADAERAKAHALLLGAKVSAPPRRFYTVYRARRDSGERERERESSLFRPLKTLRKAQAPPSRLPPLHAGNGEPTVDAIDACCACLLDASPAVKESKRRNKTRQKR